MSLPYLQESDFKERKNTKWPQKFTYSKRFNYVYRHIWVYFIWISLCFRNNVAGHLIPPKNPTKNAWVTPKKHDN